MNGAVDLTELLCNIYHTKCTNTEHSHKNDKCTDVSLYIVNTIKYITIVLETKNPSDFSLQKKKVEWNEPSPTLKNFSDATHYHYDE